MVGPQVGNCRQEGRASIPVLVSIVEHGDEVLKVVDVYNEPEFLSKGKLCHVLSFKLNPLNYFSQWRPGVPH